jgi:hypothetical protein
MPICHGDGCPSPAKAALAPASSAAAAIAMPVKRENSFICSSLLPGFYLVSIVNERHGAPRRGR